MRHIILVTFIMFFTSCSDWGQDKYHLEITMERDGEVKSYPKGELDIAKQSVFAESIIVSSYSTYVKTNIVVDKDKYNFLIVIPIKTKQSLNKLEYMYCNIDNNLTVPFNAFKPTTTSTVDESGYYHYLLHVDSRLLATGYYLNDIKDADIYFDFSKHGYSNNIEITSNKLTIPKEEFEHMLERLAISHERLSFQPEGY